MIQNIGGGSLVMIHLLRRHAQESLDSATRLGTMRRINSGADDPAGLIAAMELQSDIESIEEALHATERSSAMLRVADGVLGSASELVLRIKGDVLAAANSTISDEERAALQMDVDAAIEALDHLGQHAQLNGQQMFDGSTRSFLVGANPSDIATLSLDSIHSAALGDSTGSLNDLRSGGAFALASGDTAGAISIANAALGQLVSQRVSIGSFQASSLDAAHASLEDALVNETSALSQILDTDVASETSRWAQIQILSRATLLAAKVANERSRMTAVLLDALA